MTAPVDPNKIGTNPAVCVDQNLLVTEDGELRLAPWSVPQLGVDVLARSGGDGKLLPAQALPGKLLIDQRATITNDAPVRRMALVTVTRGPKHWITSNPNAIQFRDRWTTAIDAEAARPTTEGAFNSQCGSAIDVGTNTVAEPNPGKQWQWRDAHAMDEWIGPLEPGQTLNLWYRCYVWTPPPWSDNANKNSPAHEAYATWARIQIRLFPMQGGLVTG